MMPAADRSRSHEGTLIVLTAPLTETIDHAGYFIQMSMASLPVWLEGILNRKYPAWRDVEYAEDGSARYMPAGVRVLEATLRRHYADAEVVACYPDDVDRFIGPRSRILRRWLPPAPNPLYFVGGVVNSGSHPSSIVSRSASTPSGARWVRAARPQSSHQILRAT